MAAFDGRWKVRRESGLLPPFGIQKLISGDHGWTTLGMIPLAPFKVDGGTLIYRLWPVRDEISLVDDRWIGRGYIFGKKFCEFSLEPVDDPAWKKLPLRRRSTA